MHKYISTGWCMVYQYICVSETWYSIVLMMPAPRYGVSVFWFRSFMWRLCCAHATLTAQPQTLTHTQRFSRDIESVR